MTDSTTDIPEGIESLDQSVNGQRIHYLKAGHGDSIVLVHGGASDSRDWINTMKALSPYHSLYAPDMIGFGQSARSKDGYYLSDFTDFLLGFFEKQGLDRVHLVGHSLGGRICLDIALRHPEKVHKLVLVDSAGLGNVSRFGSTVLTGFWLIRKLLGKQQPFPQFLDAEGDDTQWLCEKELPGLNMPVLLVWKHFDIYLPVSIARRAMKLIPDARLEVVPGFGHAPHGQNNAAFNILLRDFFANN
jgi:pimeloyl-ACP methyl ester carboxylesterase